MNTIICPHCKQESYVVHFEWLALVCQSCKKEVTRKQWLMSVEQAVQLRVQWTKRESARKESSYKHEWYPNMDAE